jgi:2-polyprenyl-3-methyl-5-hydroxy-6-metoxy-1,4-benzoquinol methylase
MGHGNVIIATDDTVESCIPSLYILQVLDVGCGIGGPLREIARFR